MRAETPQEMSAEVFESSAALARASLLLANLERASVDLSDLVRRTEREDASTTLAMAGSELSALGEQLGALVFRDNYASGHEQRAHDFVHGTADDESETHDAVVLAPEDVVASFRYDSLGPRFQQDIEKSKNIGVQRSQRMLVAYEHFRSEQELAFRRKMHKIRNKSGIEKQLQTVAGKERQLEKLLFELQSKRELLTAKNDPTESNVTYAERELARLLRCLTDGRRHIADTLAVQGKCDSLLDSLRLELDDLTKAGSSSSRAGSAISSYSNRKLARFKANRKRYANSSHVELDMLEDSFSDIKRLVEDSAYVQQRIANCESEIKLKQETLEVMMRKDEYKELKRIRALCEKLHAETTSYKDRVQWLERSLLARIASGGVKLLNIDSYEGKQLVAGLLERKSNREAVKQEAREMRIQAQLPKPDPVPIRVPLATFNFHLAPQELYVAMQASTLLKSRLPRDDVSASGGIDQLPILKSSKLPEVGSEGVIPPPQRPDPLENPLMNTMLAIGKFDQDATTPSDDHGIPAILEQLQTIEDMLLGAPKRKPYDMSGGVEDIREELVTIRKEVVRSFKAIKEVTASIKTLQSDQGGSLEERDALRVAFLEKIAGRDCMPLTINARQDEVNSLTNSLLEARADLKGLKKQLRATAKELESAQTLFDKLKSTPILAAQEVDRLEKEATSPKPLIRVEVKGKPKDPAKHKPPLVSLQQPQQQQQPQPQPQRPTTPEPTNHPKAIIRVRVTTEKQARLPVPTVASANPLLCNEPPPVEASNNMEEVLKAVRPPEPLVPRTLRIAHVVNLSSSTALAPRGAARDGARPKHFSHNLQK